MDLAPETRFRRRLLRIFDPRGRTFAIADGDDAWGLVVTKKVVSGVQVWYSAKAGVLTLALTSPEMRAAIPPDAVPPDAEAETSGADWRMFRHSAPILDLQQPPEDQQGTDRLVELIVASFEWVRRTRTDMLP